MMSVGSVAAHMNSMCVFYAGFCWHFQLAHLGVLSLHSGPPGSWGTETPWPLLTLLSMESGWPLTSSYTGCVSPFTWWCHYKRSWHVPWVVWNTASATEQRYWWSPPLLTLMGSGGGAKPLTNLQLGLAAEMCMCHVLGYRRTPQVAAVWSEPFFKISVFSFHPTLLPFSRVSAVHFVNATFYVKKEHV